MEIKAKLKTLFDQIDQGELDKIKYSIRDNPILINTRNDDGLTPLKHAIYGRKIEIAEWLIKNGAKLNNEFEDGGDLLLYASIIGNEVIVKFLIKNNVNPNYQNEDGYTPLHFSISKGHKDIVNLLILNGADKELKNKLGKTSLMIACEENNREIAELLLAKGANLDSQAKNNLTPLHLAAIKDNLKIAEILLNNGANLEAKTRDGWTPIKLASDHGNYRLVHFFITKGANPDIIKKDNRSNQQKNFWVDAAYRNESGESPPEIIKRIHTKYFKDTVKRDNLSDAQHQYCIDINIFSRDEKLANKIDRIFDQVYLISDIKKYTDYLIEDDFIPFVINRYKFLQRDKEEMRSAIIAKNLSEARIAGFGDIEIEENLNKIIRKDIIDIWIDKFDMWMELEYGKMKDLLLEEPTYENVEYILRYFIFSEDIMFYDISDIVDFFQGIPSVIWEEKLLDILSSIDFKKILCKNFFILLDYSDKFQNQSAFYEILIKWEKELDELIKSGKINRYIKDKDRLIMQLFSYGPEKKLEDIRNAKARLRN